MQTVHFPVQKTGTGYCAYAEDYSILATGKTIKVLQQEAEELLTASCEVQGVDRSEYTILYTYDFPSLVAATRLNVDALSSLTGLNASLMSQYLSGKKKPGPKQKQRIEAGVKQYARMLDSFQFA